MRFNKSTVSFPPVLRTGQQARTIVGHMIKHRTKRLVQIVTDGLSFEPFVG
jgi:hypothetical protein